MKWEKCGAGITGVLSVTSYKYPRIAYRVHSMKSGPIEGKQRNWFGVGFLIFMGHTQIETI